MRRGRGTLKGLLLCLNLCAVGAVPVSATAATCPNEAIREAQTSEDYPLGTTGLPACMAFEMVTPTKKLGQETFTLNAFSTDGERTLFVSKAALADTESLQSFGGDSYVASRGAAGWVTAPTSPPSSAEITGGGAKHGGPYAFDSGLENWVLYGATQEQRFSGKGQIFSDGLSEAFAPLSPLLAPIDNSGLTEAHLLTAGFPTAGTAADLSTTVFRVHQVLPFISPVAYLPEDPRDTSEPNSYVAFRNALGEATVQLLARDETGKVWGGRCGAFLGGGGLNQGAISAEGGRIFFSTRPAQVYDPAHPTEAPFSPDCSTSNPLRILIRTGEGPEIEELLPGGPSEAGDDLYQAASLDGSKVFLTSPRNLASSDGDTSPEECSSTVGASKGCDLYLYDAELPEGERLIQVSAGEDIAGEHEEGKGANVLSPISAISADGSHAYFAAQGVLTEDQNPEGDSAEEGKPNLYLYDRDSVNPNGQISFMATLTEADEGKAWGAGQAFANDAPYPVPLLGGPGGGDGHVLFFLSRAALTPEDTDGFRTDVYRYDSSGATTLQCVSCGPGGDSAAVDATAGSTQASTVSNFAQLGRWASEDGLTAAFATGAPLTPEDEDDGVNIYLWREGQLLMLPSEITGEARNYKLPTVSASGNQVGFTTTKALLPQDIDATRDAYVVRVDGGFPNPSPPPTACDPLSEGACQGQGSGATVVQDPGTSTFSGPGNAKKPAKCRKGQVRKRGNCVKRGRKQTKNRKNHKQVGHKRGGSK